MPVLRERQPRHLLGTHLVRLPTQMTEPLFPMPPTPPVRRAKTLRDEARQARPSWSRYRPKNRVPCDECMRVLHEDGGIGPYARSARWKRVLAGVNLLLCNEHADLWRVEDSQ